MDQPIECPFCGWGTIVDSGIIRHACTCSACGARGAYKKTWKEAVESWNHRYKDTPQKLEIIFTNGDKKKIMRCKERGRGKKVDDRQERQRQYEETCRAAKRVNDILEKCTPYITDLRVRR